MRTPEEIQKTHGERVEARQRERAFRPDPYVSLDENPGELMARLSKRPTRAEEEAKIKHAADAFLTALLLDLITHDDRPEPAPQDRIDLIDNNVPPFFRFWQKLNAGLNAAGKPDADHQTAMTAFEGGPTPIGALTFIGKQWDGIRAVPGPGHDDTRVPMSYYGEFREVSDNGTVWRVVANKHGRNIAYSSVEGALTAAKHAKKHSEDHS